MFVFRLYRVKSTHSSSFRISRGDVSRIVGDRGGGPSALAGCFLGFLHSCMARSSRSQAIFPLLLLLVSVTALIWSREGGIEPLSATPFFFSSFKSLLPLSYKGLL